MWGDTISWLVQVGIVLASRQFVIVWVNAVNLFVFNLRVIGVSSLFWNILTLFASLVPLGRLSYAMPGLF